ncbi:hypothetical protein B0J17DRAFT_668489 [Rhizoctonia solani]|nr:hypothetical protein B0J17DRAFT_668489 [Rhizoctonia solani]
MCLGNPAAGCPCWQQPEHRNRPSRSMLQIYRIPKKSDNIRQIWNLKVYNVEI